MFVGARPNHCQSLSYQHKPTPSVCFDLSTYCFLSCMMQHVDTMTAVTMMITTAVRITRHWLSWDVSGTGWQLLLVGLGSTCKLVSPVTFPKMLRVLLLSRIWPWELIATDAHCLESLEGTIMSDYCQNPHDGLYSLVEKFRCLHFNGFHLLPCPKEGYSWLVHPRPYPLHEHTFWQIPRGMLIYTWNYAQWY